MTNWMIYYCVSVICSSLVNDIERAGAQVAGEDTFLSYLGQQHPIYNWVKSIAELDVFALAILAPFFADKWWHPIFLFVVSFILSFFIIRPLMALVPWKGIIKPMKVLGWLSFITGILSWVFLF